MTNTIASRINQVYVDNFDFYGSIDTEDDEGVDEGQCIMLGSYTVETDMRI